jgi:hypothetical protein
LLFLLHVSFTQRDGNGLLRIFHLSATAAAELASFEFLHRGRDFLFSFGFHFFLAGFLDAGTAIITAIEGIFSFFKHLPAALHLAGLGQPAQGLNAFLVAIIFCPWCCIYDLRT